MLCTSASGSLSEELSDKERMCTEVCMQLNAGSALAVERVQFKLVTEQGEVKLIWHWQ